MGDKWMCVQNYPSVDFNWWFKHIDIQLNKPTNQNSIKVPKAIKPMNEKTLL